MDRKNNILSGDLSEKKRIEKYLQFVMFFNKFINHQKKIRRKFIEKEMKL